MANFGTDFIMWLVTLSSPYLVQFPFKTQSSVFFFLPLWSSNSLVYNCNPSSVFPSVDSILDPTDHLTSINCSFWPNECLHSWDAAASPQLVCTDAMWPDNQPTVCHGTDCCLSFFISPANWCRCSSLHRLKQLSHLDVCIDNSVTAEQNASNTDEKWIIIVHL